MKAPLQAILTAALIAALPALAQHGHEGHHASPIQAATTSPGGYTGGEVKNVDRDAGKVTLKRGAIENIGMPAMTMAYRAKDPSILDQVKIGDTVKFKAEHLGGAIVVTEVKPGP